MTKYTELWDWIKNKVRTINGGKAAKYEKDFMKIKIDSDDNLPLSKILKLHKLTVIVISVFEEEGNIMHKFFEWMFVWIIKLEYDKIDISEGTDINKTDASKECNVRDYWYFKYIGFQYEQ